MEHTVEDIRKQITEILGLETAPDGEENMLLIRNAKGKITEGIPMSEEVEQLLDLFSTILDGLVTSREQKIAKGFDVTPWLRNYGIDDDTTLTAGEAEEMLEQYSWDLLTEFNAKISTIRKSLKGEI